MWPERCREIFDLTIDLEIARCSIGFVKGLCFASEAGDSVHLCPVSSACGLPWHECSQKEVPSCAVSAGTFPYGGLFASRARRPGGIETTSRREAAGCITGGGILTANETLLGVTQDGSTVWLLWSRRSTVMMRRVGCHLCKIDKTRDGRVYGNG